MLRTVPPYRLAKRRYAMRLDAILDDFDAVMRSARNVEFYYIPHSGAAMVLESVLADGAVTQRPPDNDQKALRQLRMVSRLMGRTPRLRRSLIARLMLAHAEERFTEDWHRAFPTERDSMRFNETEWHLPPETAPDALREVVGALERAMPGLFFPMEVRLTGGDDLYLSPFTGGERVSIAVHDIAVRDFTPVLDIVEPIFIRHGGRPHWGKMHRLTAAELRPLYPHWDEAIDARRHYDPDGRFLTPYLRRMLGL
ncbi:MAG: D-arabinono-1,4-lactone oxidase [Paracoccus sp. (in: a-proteobacteria)]|nr:D-arabinono-1,4-lactone oxidase [Paracoccus sp. (in: a-proteobacteria)]